jgi:hypothetical protein
MRVAQPAAMRLCVRSVETLGLRLFGSQHSRVNTASTRDIREF